MPLSLEPSPIAIYASLFAKLKQFVVQPIDAFVPTFEEINKAKEIIEAASQFYDKESDFQEAFNRLKFLEKDDFWVSVTMKVFERFSGPTVVANSEIIRGIVLT